MTVLGLAMNSIRHRAGGFVASFLTLLLGATIVMTFASLLDTSTAAGVDADTAENLTIMSVVVGSWGLVIVGFAVMSTLTLLVRQRFAEMALLKSIGATPGQIGRMVVGETVVVAVAAAAVAVVPAMFAGQLLIDLLIDAERVPAGVGHEFGPVALGMGFSVTVLAAVAGAASAAWRANRVEAKQAMLAASVDSHKTGRWRVIGGLVALAGGVNCAVMTAFVLDTDTEALMAVAAQGSILSAIGLALLAPAIVRAVLTGVAAPLRWFGASGYLSVENLRGRTQQMAGTLVPIILFTGMSTGTLYMQSIENTLPTRSMPKVAETIETLNYVVVGMISLFTAVVLINTLVAATLHRRREFGQLRLVGSTRPQVLGMVALEGTVLSFGGVLFGSIASIATVIPYSIAKTGSVLPDATIKTYLGIVGIAALLTLTASLGTARKAVHTPALQAVAA